jgi:hypothetical protein
MELFSEILDHVVSFGFTVDQEVDADLFLEADNNRDLFLDEFLVFSFGNLPFAELSASLTDLLGLLQTISSEDLSTTKRFAITYGE